MAAVDCRSQPKVSNVEDCPNKCPNGCTNGYCDCATGECLCNPGFSGATCTIDTCTAAGCVNGNCAAQYLGGKLLVSKKPCVCIDGWYGDRCDTTTPPPPETEPAPTCLNGCYYFTDSDIIGGNLAVIQTSDPKACCAACNANPSCTSWVLSVICFLKTGTQRGHSPGIISGIKCSAGTNSSTIVPATIPPITNDCDDRCKGQYPYGCNSGFQTGYCNAGGGCTYATTNDPNWCCFKGCNQQTTVATVTTVSTSTEAPVPVSCDNRCLGQFPYGCNPSFSTGYCNSGGGCSYSTMTGPNWCCFKGC
ncbi:hypothetical protein I4U23_004221 [Adineta vaga]|nr:hypothetical protein I4U23_004221 [Adineta vaga]